MTSTTITLDMHEVFALAVTMDNEMKSYYMWKSVLKARGMELPIFPMHIAVERIADPEERNVIFQVLVDNSPNENLAVRNNLAKVACVRCLN